MAIWQDLVDQHGFAARYASVRRFVVKLRGERTPEAHPVIVTPPGEEGQVDYGEGPMVASGQIKLRSIDGWQKIATVLSHQTVVAA